MSLLGRYALPKWVNNDQWGLDPGGFVSVSLMVEELAPKTERVRDSGTLKSHSFLVT